MTSLKVKNPAFISGYLLLDHGDGWRQAGTQSDQHLSCDDKARVTKEVNGGHRIWNTKEDKQIGEHHCLKDISCIHSSPTYWSLCGFQRNRKTTQLTATCGSRPWRQISKRASSQTKRKFSQAHPPTLPIPPQLCHMSHPSRGLQGILSDLCPRIAGAADSSQCSRGKDSTQEPALAISCYITSTLVTATVCWETEWHSIKENITQLSLHLALLFSHIARYHLFYSTPFPSEPSFQIYVPFIGLGAHQGSFCWMGLRSGRQFLFFSLTL